MVVRKSTEYQRAFKPAETYRYETFRDANSDYRLQRRQVEHAHHADLFCWEDSSSEEEELPPRPASVPAHKVKHDKYKRAHQLRVGKRLFQDMQDAKLHNSHGDTVEDEIQDAWEHLQISSSAPVVKQSQEGEMSEPQRQKQALEHLKDQGVQTLLVELKNKRVQTPEWESIEQETNTLPQKKSGIKFPGTSKEMMRQAVSESKVKDTKRSKAVHQKKVGRVTSSKLTPPKSRPMSAPAGRKLKQSVGGKETEGDAHSQRPLFLPFGNRNESRAVAEKLTHNVRAPTSVYPAALRAEKRRQIHIEKQKEEQRKAYISRERRQQAYFNEKMRRETSGWETEYSGHYAGFDPVVYARSLSSRLAPVKKGDSLIIPYY